MLQPAAPSFIRCRQSAATSTSLLRWEPFPFRALFQGVPSGTCPPRQAACSQRFPHGVFQDFRMNFPPSQLPALLADRQSLYTTIQVIPVFPSTPLPGFIGGNFITTTESSATRQRILPFSSLLLAGSFPLRDATGLPRLRRVPCEQCHPQTHHGPDQVSGFALFCTLAHPFCRIRFAFAMYRSLPIASFRPCRCQQRPCNSDCLPPGRGDACVPQAGFARHAGQTKKGGCQGNHPFFGQTGRIISARTTRQWRLPGDARRSGSGRRRVRKYTETRSWPDRSAW